MCFLGTHFVERSFLSEKNKTKQKLVALIDHVLASQLWFSYVVFLFGYFSRFLSPLPPGLQTACLSLRGEEFKVNKNTLIAAFRLACLEIRSRNEETINYWAARQAQS